MAFPHMKLSCKREILLKCCLVVFSLSAVLGCSRLQGKVYSARSAFPLKYFYYPSYEAIGAAYSTNPALAIELLERRSRKDPENLAYRLTLADMYKDRGRVNDAIRLWFEILAMGETDGVLGGGDLQVYFIPVIPYQEEGMRSYTQTIDKSFAYSQIGLIFEQNSFWKEAAESFAKAAQYAGEPNRKARMLMHAGAAMGGKEGTGALSARGTSPQQAANNADRVDPMADRRREKQYYEEALALPISDTGLRRQIEERLDGVTGVLVEVEGPTATPGPARQGVQEPLTTPAPAGAAALAEVPVTAGEPEMPERVAPPRDLQARALKHFELGDLDAAVPLWQERFHGFSADTYLIEVALNCSANSLVYTFDKLGNTAAFFVLPKVYQGKQCYRLFLGAYPDEEAARGQVAVVEGLLGKIEPRVWGTGLLQRILSGT